MNTDRFPRPIPILSMAALIGWLVIIMAFGGRALAADRPDVAALSFKDAKGAVTMKTGYLSYRVATDAGGNVYVTDPEVNTVYKYNTNGHLVGTYKIMIPRGVSVNSSGDIYVGGILNGSNAIFDLGVSKEGNGLIGKVASDIEADSTGNIFVIDSSGAVVTVLNKNLEVSKTLGPLGPYEDRYNGPEAISTSSFSNTRHRLTSASGIAVSDSDLYVVYREYVDYLTNSTTSCSSGYSVDSTAYLNYPNTDATYQYWCSAGSRSVVADIAKSDGQVKNRIQVDPYVLSSSQGSGTELNPQGIALDSDKNGNIRIYVATGAGIKVYDAATGALLFPATGAFAGSSFLDLSFDVANKRIIGTTGNMVLAYGIDGGSNPANTPPSAPVLVSPSNKTYVNSSMPVLKVTNATDKEGDPLTYEYEIMDLTGTSVNSGVSIPQGSNGETALQVNSTLDENTRYIAHSRAFDGNDNSICWSDEKWDDKQNKCVTDATRVVEFCVNEKHLKPTPPIVVSPKGSDPVSPFSSVLAWSAPTDPGLYCYNYLAHYAVEVSADPAFGSVQSATANSASIKLSDVAKGLINGASYYWRVKAVDNTGAESAYTSGSFVYKTTVVRFESDQPGAKVYIDGNYGYNGRLVNGQYDESGNLNGIKSLPLEVNEITPGSHFVTFIKAGYEPYHVIINIKDPLSLIDDGALTVSASADKWVKASKITPAVLGVELPKLNGGNAAPFVVDYNNDGLKDIVSGGKVNAYNDNGDIVDVIDGRVYLFLAQPDGTMALPVAIHAGEAEINVGSRAVPFVVDWNNDGKKDLLVGNADGYIYIYLNIGDDSVPQFVSHGRITVGLDGQEIQDIKVTSNAAPTIIDYDNDGRKDLVVGSADGTLRLYINKGTDDSPKFDAVYSSINADGGILTATSSSSAFFADWNNDGKKDLVVGGDSLHIFLNVGSDDAPNFLSTAALQTWIKDKKKVKGNREYVPYLGYNSDLDYVSGDNLVPFVVDWSGTSSRDIIVGGGNGSITEYQAE